MILTGKLHADTLKALEDFTPFYQHYQVDTNTLQPLFEHNTLIEITVIVGTWCPDCHREVAHFIRIIETLTLTNKYNTNIQVTYLGVDRDKHDSENLTKDYQFSQIPTFIIQQNGKEVGRIIESPTHSLESDLVNILNR